jgi:paraquat-inducible protein B
VAIAPTEQAEIGQGRSFSDIWIIPLIALLLGVYMVVHTWLTEGPTITVAFDTASGLEQGKTKIKYRSVNMGVVEEVLLTQLAKKIAVSLVVTDT